MKTADKLLREIREEKDRNTWMRSEGQCIKLIESRDAEIHAMYKDVVERVDSALDSYCQYFLADDDSQEESQWRKQMEMDIASLAIEVRGENFLIDFDNKIAAIKEVKG